VRDAAQRMLPARAAGGVVYTAQHSSTTPPPGGVVKNSHAPEGLGLQALLTS